MRYVQDPETGKLVPASEYRTNEVQAAYVIGDLESFKSPIDGTLITDRAQLRHHHKKHGTTDSRDYSQEYYNKAEVRRDNDLNGKGARARAERIETIQHAIYQHHEGQ